jgi:cytochrome c oxidase subunit 2
MKRLRSKRSAALLVVVGGLLLAGCQVPTFGAYRGATTQGQDSFKLWQLFMIAGIVVFAIVFLLILWSIIRYRRRDNAIPRQFQYNTLFEVFYTVTPLILVLVLFAFTVVTENEVTAVPVSKVNIDVTAFQWGWRFFYPATGKTVIGQTNHGPDGLGPQMVVPTGEKVHIYLVSADVVHGFYVPQFNYQIYAQPGHPNNFDFTVLKDGTYRGQCSELCGLYHSLMYFSIRSVSPDQFDTWVHTGTGTAAPTISQIKASIAGRGPGT